MIQLLSPSRTLYRTYTLIFIFLILLSFSYLSNNLYVHLGTMPPKGTSSTKQVTKKGNKNPSILSFESIKSSRSSGDCIEYQWGKRLTQEAKDLWGEKNGHSKWQTSTRTKDGFEEESLQSASGAVEEVDMPPIDARHPPLAITLAPVHIVEWYGYPDM